MFIVDSFSRFDFVSYHCIGRTVSTKNYGRGTEFFPLLFHFINFISEIFGKAKKDYQQQDNVEQTLKHRHKHKFTYITMNLCLIFILD